MGIILLILVVIVVSLIVADILRSERRRRARLRHEAEFLRRFTWNCDEDHDAVIAAVRRQLQIGPKGDEE